MISNFFVTLSLNSKSSEHILSKVKASSPDQWTTMLDQSIYKLTINDFNDDPDIVEFITRFGANERLSVFRYVDNICFQWHKDRIRSSALNMVLEGFDSFCAFGILDKGNTFSKITRLEHKPNKYYLMNVKEYHTVFNFSNERYILSIGLEQPYEEVTAYLKEKNLI